MHTLKELSLAATVKMGVGPRGDGDVPPDLKEELERIENDIQTGMTGRFHHHRDLWDNEDIEIKWERIKDSESSKQWSQWHFFILERTQDRK